MDMAEKSSFDSLLKHHIIKNIYFDTSISCADLSERVGKSIPVVTKAISELIESGLVVENGYAASTGGRRPLVYSLKANEMFIISVAMDQLYTRIAVMDASNTEVIPASTVELHLMDNKHSVEELIDLINTKISEAGIDRNKIIGVGIGMPGFVNSKLGINYSYLKAPGIMSLRNYLEKELQLAVHIDNDSSIIALAESKFGLAKGRKDVMVINMGWGIGLGMIMNGELFRGHNGYAGEFSHIPFQIMMKPLRLRETRLSGNRSNLGVVANKAIQMIHAGKITNLPLKEQRGGNV